MAVVNINTIKNWFKTGMIPTQDQFWSVFDSYRHKNDNIPVAEVEGINELLATRASQQVLDNHLAQKGAPNGYAPLDEFTKLAAQYLNIVNDLVTGGATALLSAEQGKVLQTQVNAINTLLTSDNVNLDTVQELVDAIETVQISLSTILVNDLTTGGTTKALTAEMGKSLKALIDAVNSALGVVQKDIAYVDVNGNDTTGVLGNIRKAFLTIDAALDALPSTGGVVKIGIGSFNSPTSAKIKSNVAFVGSKEPKTDAVITITTPNSRPLITAPTKLIDGTIFTGMFSILNNSNVRLENLGVDVGKSWVDTFNAGVPVGALVIASTVTTLPSKNITVNNVTAIGYSADTVDHCMLFENITDSCFSNLTTYYNVHGVVIKGLNVTLDGVNAHSHGRDAIIIKSDTYAPCRDIAMSNVNISSLNGYEGAGIILEEGVNGSSLLERVSLSNVNIKYTSFGIKNVNYISSINLSNINMYDISSFGVKFDSNVDKINISSINIIKTATEGIDISIGNSQVVNITNANVSEAIGAGFKLTTSGTGIINISNTNTSVSAASYVLSGTGVFGNSNFGTGTYSGVINFDQPFVKSRGRVFSIDDSNFDDLASTSGSLDFNFSNSSQVGKIESYNFTTALKKPLEISSLNFNVSPSGVTSLGVFTVSTLPTPTTTAYATVTDAVAPTYLGALTGGGSVKCPVFYNGTSWVSH